MTENTKKPEAVAATTLGHGSNPQQGSEIDTMIAHTTDTAPASLEELEFEIPCDHSQHGEPSKMGRNHDGGAAYAVLLQCPICMASPGWRFYCQRFVDGITARTDMTMWHECDLSAPWQCFWRRIVRLDEIKEVDRLVSWNAA